jgi:uncharacterized protein
MFNNQRYSSAISSGFMQKVYGWMCAGLAITAAISYYLSPEVNPILFKTLHANMLMVFGLFIAQFGILMYMTWNFARLSYATMGALFLGFCALQGVSLAPILYIYTGASVFYVFMIACSMFAIMAVYGWFTNSDLSSMGNVLLMGMIGLIVAGLINMFIQSAMFNMAISAVGVGIFAMLIAYDIQNLKKYSQYGVSSPDDMGKFALLGAVSLYLNLINIFIYLLQLFGQKRRD